MKNIKILKARFLEIQEAFENGEDDEQIVYDFEEQLQDAFHEVFKEEEAEQLEKLNKRVQAFKREYDFYDADAELDRMFPERHEEGFDEDSMSWDSVFGDD
jgi:hypothetical protein